MRLKSPRISPLTNSELSPEARAVLEPLIARKTDYNVFRTLTHHPKALGKFLGWATYVLSPASTLGPRERELAILRVGYQCRAGYEWAQHVRLGRSVGLSGEEIERIKIGPTAKEWSEADRAILQACDELVADHFIADPTWASLSRHFSKQQMIDLVFAIGQYTMVSMALNSFGVQLDADLTPDKDLARE